MSDQINLSLLTEANKIISDFGNRKRRRWLFWEVDNYEKLANKTNVTQLTEEINRHDKSFILIRAMKHLFTPIASKRSLLTYIETRRYFTAFAQPSLIFDESIKFLTEKTKKLGYFSTCRSALQRLKHYFLAEKRSIDERKIIPYNRQVQHVSPRTHSPLLASLEKKPINAPDIMLSNCLDVAIAEVKNLLHNIIIFNVLKENSINRFKTVFRKILLICHPDKVSLEDERALAAHLFPLINDQFNLIRTDLQNKKISYPKLNALLRNCLNNLTQVKSSLSSLRKPIEGEPVYAKECEVPLKETDRLAKEREEEKRYQERMRKYDEEAERYREEAQRDREVMMKIMMNLQQQIQGQPRVPAQSSALPIVGIVSTPLEEKQRNTSESKMSPLPRVASPLPFFPPPKQDKDNESRSTQGCLTRLMKRIGLR